MKKVIGIFLVFILTLLILTNVCYGLNATLSVDKTKVKAGDEVTVTVTFSEKVVAVNFNIDYDSSCFKYIEGENINSAEKNENIACIYADSTLKGTNTFSVKFKALKEISSAEFSIEDAKIRVEGEEESITEEAISGLEEVEVRVEGTTEYPEPRPEQPPQPRPEEPEEPEPIPTITTKQTSTTTSTTTTAKTSQSSQSIPKAGIESKHVVISAIIVLGIIAVITKKKLDTM